MKQMLALVLSIILLSNDVQGGEYMIDENGDGGRETYLKLGDDLNFVIVNCAMDDREHNFEIALQISDPPSGSMLETFHEDAESSVSGSVCVGAFCRQYVFEHSGYFGGPSTIASFDANQVNSAGSMAMELPGGLSLKWEGKVSEMLSKACR